MIDDAQHCICLRDIFCIFCQKMIRYRIVFFWFYMAIAVVLKLFNLQMRL